MLLGLLECRFLLMEDLLLSDYAVLRTIAFPYCHTTQKCKFHLDVLFGYRIAPSRKWWVCLGSRVIVFTLSVQKDRNEQQESITRLATFVFRDVSS